MTLIILYYDYIMLFCINEILLNDQNKYSQLPYTGNGFKFHD
jgi:hypothetical protein